MSSLDYAELAGLRIAMGNLALKQDQPEVKPILDWITSRIAELSVKK